MPQSSPDPAPWRLSADTTPEAEAVYFAILGKMSLERKLELWGQCMEMGRELAAVGILRDHPGMGERELRIRTAILWYGKDLVRRAFPESADWLP